MTDKTHKRHHHPGARPRARHSLRIGLWLILILAAALLPVAVMADTFTLTPSGSATGDNVSYSGGTAATALDTNDGGSSYGSSSGSSNDFYLELDDSAVTGSIDSVRVSAYVACASSCGGGWGDDDPTTFRVGLKTNSSEYFASSTSRNSTSYSLFHGNTYATNPNTGEAWTWDEIDALVAIVDHTNSTTMRVTQLYATITYTPDTTEPDAVTDLAIHAPTSNSVSLTWTAPGDDGDSGTAASYDVRYSTSTITDGNWSSATQATGEPTPSVAGTSESFTVSGLDPGTTYYFAIKATDDATLTSALSNVPSATTDATDSTVPATITLSAGSSGENSILLTWTAPGDDNSTGTATSYDIRYSTSAINDGNWSSATQVSAEPSPQIAGSTEYFTVTGLSASTTYYFAIKTSDEVPNTSALSNSPSATTSSGSGGSLVLHPSGSATGDNVSYSGGTAATALDTNDGGSSYGSSSGSSNDFYLELDDSAVTGSIDSVRVSAYVACASSCGGGWGDDDPTTFRVGLKTNSSEYFASSTSRNSTSYSLFHGNTYATNPNTGEAWTWDEIDALVAIVDHTNSTTTRVTELYATVSYTPGDSTAPDAVSDLATGTITSSSVELNWTAPGDDSDSGTASVYDVRYSTSTITEANWAYATQATGEPSPSSAGSGETFTVTDLDPGTTYYFAMKTRDEVPNISSLSNVVSATTYDPPVGGYTDDNVVPSAQISQATDGSGVITINWKGRDNQSDNVTLKTFEYSVNGGSSWNAPTNGDASGSLSANWDDNGGGGWSTDTTFGAASAHSFTFDTQHADVIGLDEVDQSDIQIRFKLNDGESDSDDYATSESFRVDNELPTATIVSAEYDADTDTLTITGTDFTTIATASTDIKSYVDWSKFVWDINGDDGTTANITFVEGDVANLTVTDATTLTLVFSGAKGTAIEGTSGYGNTAGADMLDVTAGFSIDAFGNVATTDGVSDGPLTAGSAVITATKLSVVISDPINGGTNPKRIPGAVIEYTVSPSNSGDDVPDADSTVVIDVIDTINVEYDATTGVTFTDGATSSGLSLDTVTYSDDPSPGPYTYDYTPVPDGDGYDGNVTSIKITTTGEFAFGGSPDPSFSIKYRVRAQ